ncbi:EF-hand domain-containing protein [Desulfolithobacter sp.]
MKATSSLIAAAIFSFLALGTATAQVQGNDLPLRGPLSFSDYDLNQDGVITEDELNTVREQRLAAIRQTGRPGLGMAKAPSFSDLDGNGDGQITREELMAARQSMWQQRGGRGMGRGKGRGMGPGMGQ